MHQTVIFARVVRFSGKVAVDVGNGQTVYLKPEDAKKLAKSLTDCVDRINGDKNNGFVSDHHHFVANVDDDYKA
jgi:hypothetical protein